MTNKKIQLNLKKGLSMKTLLSGLFLVLITCACGTPERSELSSTGISPDTEENSFNGVQGKVFHQQWRTKNPRGAIMLIHGLKDHSSRYGVFARELNNQGFSVYALDLPGHGKSEGPRSSIGSMDKVLQDIETFHNWVAADIGSEKPIFVFGHSMGGGIAARYGLSNPDRLAGIILSAAALSPTPDVTTVLKSVVKNLARVLPKFRVLDLPHDRFSRDPNMLRAMSSDPLVDQKKIPAKTAAEILDNMEEVTKLAAGNTIPVLALHGTADVITNPEGSAALIEALDGSKYQTLIRYEGLYHDLLHEPESDEVVADILNWLDRVSAL